MASHPAIFEFGVRPSYESPLAGYGVAGPLLNIELSNVKRVHASTWKRYENRDNRGPKIFGNTVSPSQCSQMVGYDLSRLLRPALFFIEQPAGRTLSFQRDNFPRCRVPS
jgi:hypothetical protein